MWPRFGVKIGNTTLCVASAKKDGKIEVIANKQGDRVSQAVLFYDGDEIEVGLTAKQKMISKGSSTVCNSFQLFPENLSEKEIDDALKHILCEFDKDSRNFLLQSPEDEGIKKMTPFSVCVELFKASFELARHYHSFEDQPSIVLSVPHYYSQSCWKNLANAAESAGFNVSQVITDAMASVIAYESIEEHNEVLSSSKHILCIKSGGLITSFTLFEVINGAYSVVGSSQPFYLGGNQFTDVLIDFISQEFKNKYHIDPKKSSRSMAKIRTAADNCKHILTTLPSTQIYIDSLMDGIDFNIQMSRARFESVIQPVINEFMTMLNNSLNVINKENHDVDEIILVGGSLKIPKLQTTIQSRFPDANLKFTFSSDEVIAIGCAQQSFYVNPKIFELESSMMCALTTSDMYIWCNDNSKRKKILTRKGTILPNKSVIELEDAEIECDRKSDGGVVIFNVQSEDDIQQIEIGNVKISNGIYRIEVITEANDNLPRIEIKCL